VNHPLICIYYQYDHRFAPLNQPVFSSRRKPIVTLTESDLHYISLVIYYIYEIYKLERMLLVNKTSNAELVILQIIAESSPISGYDINKLIEQRGYREWAKIGTTSIYAGLQKLKEKGLIQSEDPSNKLGKGPLPVKFAITEEGKLMLHNEIIDCLSTSRERDIRFELGIAALPFISKEEASEALQKRHTFLRETSIHIQKKCDAQGGEKLPLQVRALFLHPISLIEAELLFMNQLISELEGAITR
jgi:DNA-binding PadR family transcriptional regulator